MVVKSSGEWVLFNVKVRDFDETQGVAPDSWESAEDSVPNPDHYYWGMAKIEDQALLAWGPEAEAVARLVNEGVPPGSVTDGNVELGKLEPPHYQIITTSSHGVLMDWDSPLVLVRNRPQP